MVEEFTLEFKAQKEWGWLAILDFFLAGGGAGLFLIGFIFRLDLAAAIGVVGVAAGALALLLDLGRPERFWRTILRPGTSWISRGTILAVLFLVFGTLHAAPTVSWFSWLPWTADGGFGAVAGAIAAVAAVGVMAYTGFLLADSPAIPAWQSGLVPIQFIALSLLTGIGGLYLLLPFLSSGTVRLQVWEGLGLGLSLGVLLMLMAYTLALHSSTSGARHAERELIRGRLLLPFLGGCVLVGLLVPLAIIAYLFLADTPLAAATPPLTLAGALLVIGALLFRYSLLKAAFYEPVMQSTEGSRYPNAITP